MPQLRQHERLFLTPDTRSPPSHTAPLLVHLFYTEGVAQEGRDAFFSSRRRTHAVLAQRDLEQLAWRAAELLRGQIHSTDYKGYVFGLLFLKRLSDRYDEETRTDSEAPAARDVTGIEFQVPDTARWATIAKATTRLGSVLNHAAAAVEAANAASLSGVFRSINFDDDRLGSDAERDRIWAGLIRHFTAIRLDNQALGGGDAMGSVYEYLVKQFADDSGRLGGEFYTPRSVVRLLLNVLDPRAGESVYDPTCGSGGMLLEAAKRLGTPDGAGLFGQESLQSTWSICRLNMAAHGLSKANIALGDTLRTPKHLAADRLRQFDIVIANPPFSLARWGSEIAAFDTFGRFSYGVPPDSKGDWAFVQHMLASCASPHGRVGVVLPLGALSRKGPEQRIRAGLIEAGLVRAVVGLPANLFYGASIPSALLFLDFDTQRQGIYFVDASDMATHTRARNTLSESAIQEVAMMVGSGLLEPGRSAVAATAAVRSHAYSLAPGVYTHHSDTSRPSGGYAAALAAWNEARANSDSALAHLDRVLQSGDFDAEIRQ